MIIIFVDIVYLTVEVFHQSIVAYCDDSVDIPISKILNDMITLEFFDELIIANIGIGTERTQYGLYFGLFVVAIDDNFIMI